MAGGGLFNHLDYSFSPGSENGTDTTYTAPGGGSPTLRKQLSVLKKFTDDQRFVDLHPAKDVIKASPAAFTGVLTDNLSKWIIYYEPMVSKSGLLQFILPAGTYNVQWINAITGQLIGKNTITSATLTVPEGNEDKVLIVTKQNSSSH